MTVDRFEQTIATPAEAELFCRTLTDLYVGTDMQFVDYGNMEKSAYVFRRFEDFMLIDMKNMFSCRYDRTRQHIKADFSDVVLVHINYSQSGFYATQMGRDYVLEAGTAGLYVNSDPVMMETSAGGYIMGFDMPRSLTSRWREAPEDVAVSARDPSHPALHMLKHYNRLLLDADFIEPATVTAMRIHMAELTGLWLCGLKDDWREQTPQARQVARVAAIRAYLDKHYARPTLTALGTGRALGLSERLVQHVMTQEGTSFSRLLAQIRAEKACAMLVNPRNYGISVTQIALDCGFTDLSSFYRAFRTRYEGRPSNFRSNGTW